MESCDTCVMCNAGIISLGQIAEHYEITSYGTHCQFSEILGLTKAISLLDATFNEEKATDKKLTEAAFLLTTSRQTNK